MAAVKVAEGKRRHIHIVQATHIHVDLIGIGARNIKRMNAAGGAKSVLGDASVEPIRRQRVLATEELERILLEIAHSPSQLTSGELNEIRGRIDTQGILFKVRVIGYQARERQKAAARELVRRNS